MEKLNENKIKKKAFGYRQGAMVGGIVGVVGALLLKKSIWLFGVIGLVGGGYIGYKVAETIENKTEFKKL